jgi:HAD superfamily hydrolase (TIGR01450 family)
VVLADRFDVFLFDLDGVVYLGDRVLPHAPESLGRLRRMGKAVRFLTNDPRPTRDEAARRLAAMGVEARPEEVVTSGWATARYLVEENLRSAYVVGSPGLVHEMEAAGIAVADGPTSAAVVVGCDERVGYEHIRGAVLSIANGARFVATNDDGSFPTPSGPWPATGAIVAAVRAASGASPVVVGKPAPRLFLAALAGLGPALRVAMVGDSPATDIRGAHQLGHAGILVAAEPPPFPVAADFRAPDATIPSLAGLFDDRVSVRHWQSPAYPWPERVAAGVAAVVLDGAGRVLLARRADNGLWGLPSGHVEPGETVTAALEREVREETGLEVRAVRLIGVYSDPVSQVFAYPSGRVTHFVTCCLRCEAIGGAVAADGIEAIEAGFFAPGNLPPELLPMHPRWLADALAGQTTAFVR